MSWHEGVRVAHDDGRGRHVRATRDIEPGELLLSEECVAAMTFRDAAACCSRCVGPLDTNKIKCERCNLECYCSRACVESGCRAYHRSEGECAAFEAALEAENPGQRGAADAEVITRGEFEFHDLPQRFLVRVLAQAGKWRGPGEPMTGRDLDAILDLEAHVPARGSPEHAWLSAMARNTLRIIGESVDAGVAYRPAAAAERDAVDQPPGREEELVLGDQEGAETEEGYARGYTVDTHSEQEEAKEGSVKEEQEVAAVHHYGVSQLTRLMCCVNCNSHTLYTREAWPLEPAGAAVYLQGSAFNHSCCPNAEFYNAGTALRVRSVRRVGAGKEVTVSYVPQTQGVVERRQSLLRQYKFACECERCQLEEQEQREKERDEGNWDEEKWKVEGSQGGDGGASKRVKLNVGDCVGDDGSLSFLVLEQMKNLLHELTALTGESTLHGENARRAVVAISEVCAVHAAALQTVKFGAEPALRLMHIVRQLDKSLSTILNTTTAAVVTRTKVKLLERALRYAKIARGEDHLLCQGIGVALLAAQRSKE